MRSSRRSNSRPVRRKRVPDAHIQISMSRQVRRKCAYVLCRKVFHPKRYWQKFCSDKCKLSDWKLHHPSVFDPKPLR